MAVFAFFFFVAAVGYLVFWGGALIVAYAVLRGITWLCAAAFWLLTRPIVWLVINPLTYIFGAGTTNNTRARDTSTATAVRLTAVRSSSMADKVNDLDRIKALLDSNTITQSEFDKMKAEILAVYK